MTPNEHLSLERKLESLVQINNKEVAELDDTIFKINKIFGELNSTLELESFIPNIYSAQLILKDIKKQQQKVLQLKEDTKKQKINEYSSLVIENARYSLRAQETYINFFFFNLDKNHKQIISPKNFINGVYLVYAHNQIINAMANFDYKMQHQYSTHYSPIQQMLLDSDRIDLIEKTREQLPFVKKILQDFYSINKMIPISYKFKVVLSPTGEGSNWNGDTRTLSLNNDSFWWYIDNGKEKLMIVQASLAGGHEMGHATHERFSKIFSKSLQASETNHENLVSIPVTEYLAVNSSYKFLD